MGLSEAEFEATYGFPKPGPDAAVVTHCIGGGRAGKAEALLQKLGFETARPTQDPSLTGPSRVDLLRRSKGTAVLRGVHGVQLCQE